MLGLIWISPVLDSNPRFCFIHFIISNTILSLTILVSFYYLFSCLYIRSQQHSIVYRIQACLHHRYILVGGVCFIYKGGHLLSLYIALNSAGSSSIRGFKTAITCSIWRNRKSILQQTDFRELPAAQLVLLDGCSLSIYIGSTYKHVDEVGAIQSTSCFRKNKLSNIVL